MNNLNNGKRKRLNIQWGGLKKMYERGINIEIENGGTKYAKPLKDENDLKEWMRDNNISEEDMNKYLKKEVGNIGEEAGKKAWKSVLPDRKAKPPVSVKTNQ